MARRTNSKLIRIFLVVTFLLSPLSLTYANAAATQADVDYSQQVSTLSQEFATVVSSWGEATANPPTFAVGKKFNAYKAKAVKASDAVLATLKKMNALKPSPGFAKSGDLLVKATASYMSAMTAIKSAINKNDAKAMKKANDAVLKANAKYEEWSKVYASDMEALNG